jgi:hypothetical protein
MIFSFLFPQTWDYIKVDLNQAQSFIETADEFLKKDRSWYQKAMSGVTYLFDRFNLRANRLSFVEAIKLARKDISEAHLVPHQNNRYYTVPSLLRKEIDKGEFKALLTPQQASQMIP